MSKKYKVQKEQFKKEGDHQWWVKEADDNKPNNKKINKETCSGTSSTSWLFSAWMSSYWGMRSWEVAIEGVMMGMGHWGWYHEDWSLTIGHGGWLPTNGGWLPITHLGGIGGARYALCACARSSSAPPPWAIKDILIKDISTKHQITRFCWFYPSLDRCLFSFTLQIKQLMMSALVAAWCS